MAEPQHQRQRGKPAGAAAACQAEIRRDAAGLGDPGAGARAGAGRDRGRSPAALRRRAQRRATSIDQLAAKYAADRARRSRADVIAMLQDLADKGFLTEAREKTS